MRFWTNYWKNRFWRDDVNKEHEPVRHAAANTFRRSGVSPGDMVYIVSLADGQLFLGGRMTVKQIASKDDAVKILRTDELYEADEHAIGEESDGTPLNLHRRLASAVSRQLNFVSPDSDPKPLRFVPDTDHLDGQTIRAIRELTPESAALLDRIIDVTDRLPRSAQPITVTEELIRNGTAQEGTGEIRLPEEIPHFNGAFELLSPGETGLFIYTDGLNLTINGDGTGESGWWVLDPARHFNRAFIFKRSVVGSEPHEVYSGRCTGFEGPDGNRFKLLLEDVRLEGTTLTNWTAFADASQNPIRFLECPGAIAEQVTPLSEVGEIVLTPPGRVQMTPEDIKQAFDALRYDYDHDGRDPPPTDEPKRTAFKSGWGDATERGKIYTTQTLKRLTWYNLGYRLGKQFHEQTPEKINEAYEVLHEMWNASTPGETKPGPSEKLDPELLSDDRKRATALLVQRLGQADFRRRLIDVYRGQCAITGCDVERVLQAAHIVPYLGTQSNAPDNGLLLRADIHNLFDSHLLSIDPDTSTVCLAPKLRDSSYAELQGVPLACPGDEAARPSKWGLRRHYENFLAILS